MAGLSRCERNLTHSIDRRLLGDRTMTAGWRGEANPHLALSTPDNPAFATQICDAADQQDEFVGLLPGDANELRPGLRNIGNDTVLKLRAVARVDLCRKIEFSALALPSIQGHRCTIGGRQAPSLTV